MQTEKHLAPGRCRDGRWCCSLTGRNSMGEVDFNGREWRGVFEPLRDPGFVARVAVDPEPGTITWPNGVDMAPEPLYESASLSPAPV